MILTYNWLNIKSGAKGSTEIDIETYNLLYQKMNEWNADQPGVWQYWF